MKSKVHLRLSIQAIDEIFRMEYKDALKYGFYEMQLSRDWYREATADVGMHKDLALYWIRVAPLLVLPIAPHFAEHIWQTVLKEPQSVQLALWPTPAEPVNVAILESGVYMRKTIKSIRDAELQMSKKKGKGKETPFNPKAPKSVRIFVASKFPDWQDKVVEAVQGAYDPKEDKVDDGKVRELLVKSGLIKDKRAMPFAQVFKVSCSSVLLCSAC
jgi:leucyl-tRNA synthetase